MSLQSLLPYWLSLLVILAILSKILKGEWQKRLQSILIVLASAFVLSFFAQILSKEFKGSSVLASASPSDKIEIPLKCDLAWKVVSNYLKSSNNKNVVEQNKTDLSIVIPSQTIFEESCKVLRQALKQNSNLSLPRFELIILLGTEDDKKYKKEIHDLVNELNNLPGKQIAALTNCLSALYLETDQHNKLNELCEPAMNGSILKGWFKDVCLLKFYQTTNNQSLLATTLNRIEDQYAKITLRLVGILFVAALSGLIGIIVIILFLSTHSSQRESTPPLSFTPNTNSLYAVFLAWFVIQISVSWVWHLFSKTLFLNNTDPLANAYTTCLTYIFCNLPGIFFIWYFIFRGKHKNFWQELGLKIPESKLSFAKIFLYGVLGWCAALPLVFVSYLIASHYLGSQGSDNPILTLVIQAVRSHQILAISIIIFTIGVLAPICEEIIFRGLLYASFRNRFSSLVAALISAICFSLAHFDKGGMLPLLSIGFVLALVYEKSRNLSASILTHGLWNLSSFTIALVVFGSS